MSARVFQQHLSNGRLLVWTRRLDVQSTLPANDSWWPNSARRAQTAKNLRKPQDMPVARPSGPQENSGKVSTAVWRRRRGDADRRARAADFPLTEPNRRFRSDSARQTDVRAGVPANASSSWSSSSGRRTPPALFHANSRFCIPLPYSCRDTRWRRRHHQASSSSDICFFAFAPGAPSDTFLFGNGGFSTSRWKTTSTPSRTNPSFSRFGLSAIFGIVMLATGSPAPLFTLRRPASSDDSPPRRTGTRTVPGRLHPADRQWQADIQ